MTRPSVGVIGAGRVGVVLAARLRALGHRVAVSGRSEASQLRIHTLLPGVEIASPERLARTSDIVLLSVPDDRLAEVAAELATEVRPGTIVAHTSGAHGRAVLAPLAAAGARTLAMHPAMTFTGTDVDLARSCVFGVTATDADAEIAETLVDELAGTVMWVAEQDRPAYHAALAHGSNHLHTIVSQAMDQLRGIGAADPAAVLRPLLTAMLDNTLNFGDAALTGPVARGDVDTVHKHLRAIDDESTRRTYRALAVATADRAEKSGRIDPITAEELRWTADEGALR